MKDKIAFNAVILAGGKGTRLRPHTFSFPKPLVPLGETPILETIIKQLVKGNVSSVTLAVNHMADLIKTYFGDGYKVGVPITYRKEEQPLGTAGSLSLCGPFESDFIVMNGDVLTDMDYQDFIRFHHDSDFDVTIAGFEKVVTIPLGVLGLGIDDALETYTEKPTISHTVSMGIYAMKPTVLEILDSSYLDMPDFLMKLKLAGFSVGCYRYAGNWFDIGNADDFDEANDFFYKYIRPSFFMLIVGSGYLSSHLTRVLGSRVADVYNTFHSERKNPNAVFFDLTSSMTEVKRFISEKKPSVVLILGPGREALSAMGFSIALSGYKNLFEFLQTIGGNIQIISINSCARYGLAYNDTTVQRKQNAYGIFSKNRSDLFTGFFTHSINAVEITLFNLYGGSQPIHYFIPKVIQMVRLLLNRKDTKAILSKFFEVGEISAKRDYVHIQDVCEAVWHCIRHQPRGKFDLGSGRLVSNLEAVQIACRHVGLYNEVDFLDSLSVAASWADPSGPRAGNFGNLIPGWSPSIGFEDGIKELVG